MTKSTFPYHFYYSQKEELLVWEQEKLDFENLGYSRFQSVPEISKFQKISMVY